jgi:hypothetical protein
MIFEIVALKRPDNIAAKIPYPCPAIASFVVNKIFAMHGHKPAWPGYAI